jgi:transcriptional regulator with XRE-family HTH domain
MQIGNQIRQLRERENISQSALARALNATRAAVNAWEMGISNPSMQSLIDLAQYFHVSVDYLLGMETEEIISLAGLNTEEKMIVLQLIHYFQDSKQK